MTPEEACGYLGISLDDDLTVELLESRYQAKLSECGNDQEKRAKIEEASNVLVDLYAELYESDDGGQQKRNESLLMKMALLMAAVFLLSFGGVMYFVYKIHTDSFAPAKNEQMLPKSEDELNRMFEEWLKKREHKEIIPPAPGNTPENINTPQNYTLLVERVMPSIVYIQTDKGFFGSGFFVSGGGDILTNYHVIDGAESVTVITNDGRETNALLKDYDSARDIALLKVSLPASVPFLRVSNTLPKQGEAVIAIGNPKGLSGTVSNGIVSAVRRINTNTMIQFTAPISEGSSGGALLNLDGEVVGITTGGVEDSQNLNFAVASDMLTPFLSRAFTKPARPLPKPKTPASAKPKLPAPPEDKSRGSLNIPGVKFLRNDDEYEIYLYTDEIEYDRQTQIAAFISIWLPKEKAKVKMRRDSHFKIPSGQDLGPCKLLYVVNFRENKYLHLRTINYCTDGSIARDYIKPEREYVWRTPGKNSRPDILMKEVKRQLRIR